MLRLATPHNLAARFRRDERGSYAVVFAVASTMLMGACAFGVNTAQLFNAHSALSNALDAAVTSTARDLTTGRIPMKDARKNVEAFLKTNLAHGFADASIVSLDTLSVDKVGKTVAATASVDVALVFPMPGMSQSKHVETETVASYSDRRIEVSMMLDVTGSMDGREDQGPEVGREKRRRHVPGVEHRSGEPARCVALALRQLRQRWRACGEERVRGDGRDRPDRAALGASLVKLVSLTPRPDNCATERKGSQAFTDASPAAAMVSRDLLLTDLSSRRDWPPARRPPSCRSPTTPSPSSRALTALSPQARLADIWACNGRGTCYRRNGTLFSRRRARPPPTRRRKPANMRS